MSQQEFALNTDAARFAAAPLKMLINGQWVDSVSGQRANTINPATGKVITTFALGDAADIDLAVKSARKAFDEGPWSTMKPAERAQLMFRLADLLESRAEEFAHLETIDNGVPLALISRAAMGCAANFRYFAGWATKITGETIPVSAPGNLFAYTRREPIGVCGSIVPWNGPLTMATMKLAAPLAVGNTIVLKPAELTPLTTLRLGELFQEAGFPDGVVNIVTGYGETAGAALAEHPQVDKIAFTGSTEVGKKVMRASADNVKKVSLELGGKSAHIIFEDADYDVALANASRAIFMNSGQACFAGSRLFVERRFYDRFVADLAAATASYKLGNGLDPTTTLGPLISADQRKRVMGYVDVAREEGAEVIAGGNAPADQLADGYFLQPTVLANVSNEMRVAREEIFGPVVCAIPFDDVDHVLTMANASDYGLGGGVCTTNLRNAHKVAHGLRTGNVWVNTYGILDPATPFGGYKQSGVGRENGAAAIDMYSELKSVYISMD